VYLQINTVKYTADGEITNSSIPVFTDMLLFKYIQSNLNIYWFVGIQFHCQQIQSNGYSVTFTFRNIHQLFDEL
jgi:hypothetical protein